MKKFIALSAAVLALCVPVMAENDVNVTVNGETVDMKGVILESRTMVPVRGVMEKLGYTVDWDAETKTATLANDENTVKITAGEAVFYVNDQAVTPDVPQTIIDGRFMLPLRAVSEAVGAEVDWDSESKTAVITTAKDEAPVKEEEPAKEEGPKNISSVEVSPDLINVFEEENPVKIISGDTEFDENDINEVSLDQ